MTLLTLVTTNNTLTSVRVYYSQVSVHNSGTFSGNFYIIGDHFDRQSSLDDNIEDSSGGAGGSAANSQRSIEVLYAGAAGKPTQPDAIKVS